MITDIFLTIISIFFSILNGLIGGDTLIPAGVYSAFVSVQEYIEIINAYIPGLWPRVMSYLWQILLYEFIIMSIIIAKRGINFTRGTGKI